MMKAPAWSNLEFFLTRLRGLPCCSSTDLGGGRGFCLYTGSKSASENWAFFPSPLEDGEPVRAALRFFGECGNSSCGAPFIWPLFNEEDAELLRRAGLPEQGRLLAMSLDALDAAERDGTGRGDDPPVFLNAASPSGALRWAEAAWLGFGGAGDAPREFQELSAVMCRDSLMRSVIASVGGRDVGSFLLVLSPREAGIYYFSVLPEFRRRGVASAMMREAWRLALSAGKRGAVLQATPSGVPFYLSFGFAPLFEIPVFSSDSDIF